MLLKYLPYFGQPYVLPLNLNRNCLPYKFLKTNFRRVLLFLLKKKYHLLYLSRLYRRHKPLCNSENLLLMVPLLYFWFLKGNSLVLKKYGRLQIKQPYYLLHLFSYLTKLNRDSSAKCTQNYLTLIPQYLLRCLFWMSCFTLLNLLMQ